MDAIQKFRNHLDPKRKAIVDALITRLIKHDFAGMDIKKLKGERNLFRVRKGKIRILYLIGKNNTILIESVEFRSDTTYD